MNNTTASQTECLKPGYSGNHYWEFPVWVGGNKNGSGYWSGDKMRCKICGKISEAKDKTV